jgi:hypothetical protein
MDHMQVHLDTHSTCLPEATTYFDVQQLRLVNKTCSGWFREVSIFGDRCMCEVST